MIIPLIILIISFCVSFYIISNSLKRIKEINKIQRGLRKMTKEDYKYEKGE